MTLAAIDDLLLIARDTALAAGALALQRRSEGVEVAATKSTPIDVVTHADRETETLIRSLLADARPNDSFLGEESGGGDGTSGLTWVVDPIDGTVNYLYGIPSWAVSIAVVEGDPDPLTWRTLAAAVLNPTTGELFTAGAGMGAFLGNSRLTAPPAVPLSEALVATGFAYSLQSREEQIAIAGELLRTVRDLRRIGAASLDLCNVALGRVNAYYERGLQPWDMAGGALVATEAGASVIGLEEAPASAEMLVAAPRELALSLLQEIERTRASRS